MMGEDDEALEVCQRDYQQLSCLYGELFKDYVEVVSLLNAVSTSVTITPKTKYQAVLNQMSTVGTEQVVEE